MYFFKDNKIDIKRRAFPLPNVCIVAHRRRAAGEVAGERDFCRASGTPTSRTISHR